MGMSGCGEKVNITDATSAGLVARPSLSESLGVVGWYTMECIGADGQVKWREEFKNTVTTAGKNLLLDTYLGGSAYTAAFKVGLKGAGTQVVGDTLASHAGWAEITTYSGNRPTPSFSAASSGTKSTSAAAAFSINGTATVAGAILIHAGSTTPGETATGTLFSAGDFSASRSVVNGDTLNVSYSLAV
jgi:hypothetical protein